MLTWQSYLSQSCKNNLLPRTITATDTTRYIYQLLDPGTQSTTTSANLPNYLYSRKVIARPTWLQQDPNR